jgi:hypothetical protein
VIRRWLVYACVVKAWHRAYKSLSATSAFYIFFRDVQITV